MQTGPLTLRVEWLILSSWKTETVISKRRCEMSYTLETVRQIWDDQDGTRYEVGIDEDSLGLVHLSFVDEDGKCGPCLDLPVEVAKLMVPAIEALIAELELKVVG